ncbi:MAG: hypothetical protein Q9186_007058 [Xanthomendoza sp. 1 TL-2023]
MPRPQRFTRRTSTTDVFPSSQFKAPEMLRIIIDRGDMGWTTEPGKEVEKMGDVVAEPTDFSFPPPHHSANANIQASEVKAAYIRLKHVNQGRCFEEVIDKYDKKITATAGSSSSGNRNNRDVGEKISDWMKGDLEGYRKKPKQRAPDSKVGTGLGTSQCWNKEDFVSRLMENKQSTQLYFRYLILPASFLGDLDGSAKESSYPNLAAEESGKSSEYGTTQSTQGNPLEIHDCSVRGIRRGSQVDVRESCNKVIDNPIENRHGRVMECRLEKLKELKALTRSQPAFFSGLRVFKVDCTRIEERMLA